MTTAGPSIPYGRHQIDDSDIQAVTTALRGPSLTQGPTVERFEATLGSLLDAAHVSVVSSGTAALHLAYTALGLGHGDEIITSPVTFSATASAAIMLGARPLFADVDPNTGNLDPASVASLIGPRTRGISAVHLGGMPADMSALRAICDRHGLWLVEDAAHALGATYRGAAIGSGSHADVATFSFHPVKHVATGEGGAVAVRDAALKTRIDRLRHHGICRDTDELEGTNLGPWYYEIQEFGFNYRLSELQCALGISQLQRHERRLARRRAIAARYRRRIDGRWPDLISTQADAAHHESAYHLFIALIDFDRARISRAEFMGRLAARGVGTQVHYIPLPHHPVYRRTLGPQPDPPGVASYYARCISLPMFPELSDAQVDYVVDTVAQVLGVNSKRGCHD